MVLDRARSEMRSLKELNERLFDGLGEGLQLVDAHFSIRHANRWLFDHFGPVGERRCHELLTADGQRCPRYPMVARADPNTPSAMADGSPRSRRVLLIL